MVLIGLLMLIIINLFLCQIYCLYRKRRSVLPKLKEQTILKKDGIVAVEEENPNPYSLKMKLIKKYLHTMDSVMRINLLVVAYIPSHHIRNVLYKFVFQMELEKNAVIYYGAEIRSPWNIHIGRGTIVGDKAILDGREGLYIGENVNISSNVSMWTLQHDLNSEMFATEGAPVVVKNRAWLSCNTIILPGVTVAEGSVIAAGGVATKSTIPYSVNGGIPAKKIGERNRRLCYEFNGKHVHFL